MTGLCNQQSERLCSKAVFSSLSRATNNLLGMIEMCDLQMCS